MPDNRFPAPGGSVQFPQGSATTSAGTTSSTTNSNSSSVQDSHQVQTHVENTTVNNMSPDAQAALQSLIAQLMGSGTAEMQQQRGRRTQLTDYVQKLLDQTSNSQAFEDAKGLMALNLQQSMEKNMPAIQRSIEGAGSSAAAMQGLLAQNLARDAAVGASALGADQAKAYLQGRNNFANTLELLTRVDSSQLQALIQALGIAKGAVQNTSSNSTTTTDGTQTTNSSGSSSTTGTTTGVQVTSPLEGVSPSSGDSAQGNNPILPSNTSTSAGGGNFDLAGLIAGMGSGLDYGSLMSDNSSAFSNRSDSGSASAYDALMSSIF